MCYVTEEEILKKKENGWILEVDLEYPAELHEERKSYRVPPGTGERGHEKGMYVRLSKQLDERPGYETPAQREAAADT